MSQPAVTILIIDKSSENRSTYRDYLEKTKGIQYEFIEVESKDACIKDCQKLRSDCVLGLNHSPNNKSRPALSHLSGHSADRFKQ